jgi:shikimate dehydrogenase
MSSPKSVDLHTDPGLFSGLDVYAVAGNPIAHSKSPVIHQHFAEQASQKMHYGRLQPEIYSFAAAAKSFFAAGGKGMNITVPFKLDAQAFADVLSSRAKLAGAVNTLWIKAGKVFGIGLGQDDQVALHMVPGQARCVATQHTHSRLLANGLGVGGVAGHGVHVL